MARLLVSLIGHAEDGGTALLMHNERLADPLDPVTIEIAKISGKRKKTVADHTEIARLEFAGSLYHDEDDGPFLPTWNIVRCIQDAATRHKLGRDVLRAIVPAKKRAVVEYEGPREIGAMWDDGRFALRKGVGISGRRVMRTRAAFTEWSAEAELELDVTVMNPDKVDQLVEEAGRYVGIGDNRPVYGRFLGSAVLADPVEAKRETAKAAS